MTPFFHIVLTSGNIDIWIDCHLEATAYSDKAAKFSLTEIAKYVPIIITDFLKDYEAVSIISA